MRIPPPIFNGAISNDLLQAAECVFKAFYAISDFKGTVHVQTRGQDLSIECLSFIPSHGSHIDSILGQLRMSAKKYHIPYSSPDPFPRVCQLQKPEGSWQRFAKCFLKLRIVSWFGLDELQCDERKSLDFDCVFKHMHGLRPFQS
jgi:hypothetical protein